MDGPNPMISKILPVVFLILLGGCAGKPLYYWGDYQDLIYTSYSKPSEALPERQITMLEADVQKAKGKNMRLPPGFRAQLGSLYYQTGNTSAARTNFELEKRSFPESAVLMDRFLKRLK